MATVADLERQFYASQMALTEPLPSTADLRYLFYLGVKNGDIVLGGTVAQADIDTAVNNYFANNTLDYATQADVDAAIANIQANFDTDLTTKVNVESLNAVRINHIPYPIVTAEPSQVAGWRPQAGDLVTQVLDEGLPAIQITENGGGTNGIYADPTTNFPVKVGDIVHFTAEVKASTVAIGEAMRLIINTYSGAVVTGGTKAVVVGTTEYTRIHVYAKVTAAPVGAYVRTLVWPSSIAANTEYFRVRRALVEISPSVLEDDDYWSGESLDTEAVGYDWTGTTGASPAVRIQRTPVSFAQAINTSHLVKAVAYGVTGDNATNDAVTLLTAANVAVKQGVPLLLPADKTMLLDSRVNFPAGLVIIANGATLRGRYVNADFIATFGANTTIIGHLKISSPAGAGVRGVAFTSDTLVDKVTVSNVTAGSGSSNINHSAVLIENATNVTINDLATVNFDYPVKVTGSSRVNIRLNVSTYVRGVYITDSKDINLTGLIHTASPNASVSPGHNGLLIDSTTHDATMSLEFSGLVVRDSGEHGFRIGGSKRVKGVVFDHCVSENAGGCGFKVLGGTEADANYHEDLQFISCRTTDAGQTAENAAAFMLQFVKNVLVSAPMVTKRNKTYSAGQGIEIQAAQDVIVDEPIIKDTLSEGYAVRQVLGNCTNVRLSGGQITTATGNGITINYTGRTFRRVSVENFPQLEVSGSGQNIVVVNTSGGSIVGTSWLTWQSVGAAVNQLAGLVTGYFCDVKAAFSGDPAFRNGSTWIDTATGDRKVRISGAWDTYIKRSEAAVAIPHGSDANFARPTGIGLGIWVGDVEPTNMLSTDIWNGPAL